MIGYLEGLDSERGIAWRCADSLSLREFLGYELTRKSPDHSTLSVIRGRIDLETHQEVFCWILARLVDHDLLKGQTIGIDATTLVDKGYHSNAVMVDLAELDLRSYASEPNRGRGRGRRKWKGKHEQQKAVYANRRRIRGERGKRLLQKRGELLERPFAHCYETGGMRRTHLRGHENILKRLLIHVGASNLGQLMRTLIGAGTPRGLHDRRALVHTTIRAAADRVAEPIRRSTSNVLPRFANLGHLPTPPPLRLAA